ncbi:MAG: ATPase [Oscillospiraceae bacterium]|nr:ATPase [Oscillospiraceae bacterium]
MGIEKMLLVNVVGSMSELDKTLLRCCESGCFHIEPASVKSGQSQKKGLEMLSEKNPYTPILKEMGEICRRLGIQTDKTINYSEPGFEVLEDFERYLEKLKSEIKTHIDERQECYKEISEKGATAKQLHHMMGMNANFEQVFNCEHAHIRLGKLPVDSYDKLEYYDETFFFVPFDKDKQFYWGMYFCTKKDKVIVDEIFSSLYFERVRIPEFVHGTPEKEYEELQDRINKLSLRVEEINYELSRISENRGDEIRKIYALLKFRHNTFDLRKNVASLNNKFYMKGFIPKSRSESFKKLFSDIRSVSVTYLPPDSEPDLTIPTKLKNGWFSRPYISLVEMYGVPVYNGINPTLFVAITYTLLFGIMFGDLGQGFVVWLAGLFMTYKLKNKFGALLTRCGFSSMIFGFVFGSFFGFEHALDPVYKAIGMGHKPIEIFDKTTFILISAVAIGVAIIAISMILNIITGFKQHDYEKAVFGCNGIAGFVFYSSVIVAVLGMLTGKSITTAGYVILLIVIPIICIFCRVPFSIAVKYKRWQLSEHEGEGGIGNFIVENFFEMFEFMLSYVSNTLSFLRVGGFVLCHAGMMLVVMTIMEMFAGAAQPIIVVVGNLFVMAMEGMIVAIQIIRLEFYEVFSRFYEGDGIPFAPVGEKLTTDIE